MTRFFYEPGFLEHETGNHPESPERLNCICRHLKATGLFEKLHHGAFAPADDAWIKSIHEPGYVDAIRQIAERGGDWLDADTCVSPGSYRAATLAVGAVCQATQEVVEGKASNAFCLVRPPGHHAESQRGMGFCLFNSVAIAADQAISAMGLNRVLIVDWDVHHGNGTQEIFWNRADVGYFSVHRSPFYPGTGAESETGTGDGVAATCNVPLSFGTDREIFFERFERALESFAMKVKPELVLVSAGFDAHHLDPIGSLGLETEDFERLTSFVMDLADHWCGGRLVSVLEGGYHLQALAESVAVHVEGLMTRGKTDE